MYYPEVHGEYLAERERAKKVKEERERVEALREELRAQRRMEAEELRVQRFRVQENMVYVNRMMEESSKYVDKQGREKIIFIYKEADPMDFDCVTYTRTKIKSLFLALLAGSYTGVTNKAYSLQFVVLLFSWETPTHRCGSCSAQG